MAELEEKYAIVYSPTERELIDACSLPMNEFHSKYEKEELIPKLKKMIRQSISGLARNKQLEHQRVKQTVAKLKKRYPRKNYNVIFEVAAKKLGKTPEAVRRGYYYRGKIQGERKVTKIVT